MLISLAQSTPLPLSATASKLNSNALLRQVLLQFHELAVLGVVLEAVNLIRRLGTKKNAGIFY